MTKRPTTQTLHACWAAIAVSTLAACGGGAADAPLQTTPAAVSVDASAEAANAGADAPAAPAALAAGSEPRETALALPTTAAAAAPNAAAPATPKVAILAFTRWDDPAYQTHIARFNMATLVMPDSTVASKKDAVVAALKSKNPGLLLGQYTAVSDVPDANAALAGPVNTSNWWLRNAAGQRVQWTGRTGYWDVNLTSATPANSSGKRWPQVKAEFDSSTFFKPRPGLDFVYTDTVWPQAVNADFKRNGSNQAWTDPAVQAATRGGFVQYWETLRTLNPNLKVVANVSPAWAASTEFKGKLHGAFLNSLIGRTWSVETSGGWLAMMAQYRAALANTVAPKAVVFNIAVASTDYKTMRYGLASALLEDGYFSLAAADGPMPAPWFDEFSAPIGSPTQTPPTAATPQGLWVRAYSSGLVLVNPSKTASATLAVGAGYKRLLGTQDPAVNSGAVVSSVTLGPREGLVLLKTAPPPPPADVQPPTPPSGLRTGAIACRATTLSWAASTDNVGVAFYDVYHDGQQMTTVAGNVLSAALTLAPGAAWSLYVNARDAAGNVSQASASLPIQVPQCQTDTTAPSTPTGLQGTVAGTSATLRWAAATDNVAVTAYDVYRNDVRVGSTAGLSFTDSGLAPNTAYRYAVAARDAVGNASVRSVSLTLTTGGACANPVCSVVQTTTETDIPWGLVALPDGTVLYGRRDAYDIVRLNPATGVKTSLGTLPNVQGTDGEGGLMGLATAPNFPAGDPWLYVYHTTATDNRIVRVQYKNGVLDKATLQVLVSGIGRNKYHNGGRLRYGPDGKLYASTGDAQISASAQDTAKLTGKVLRLNPDGSVPADNPFGNYVWSYGHRNPQGLAFDSQGRLWEQEFGNSVMDETNLIVRGGNYGWPNCEGTASQGGTGCATPGFIAPKLTYPTAEGSCSGIAIVRDVLYVACQRGARVYRAVITGSTLGNVQQLFVGTYGRLRTVEPSIDGGLWLASTNGGDKDSIANNSSNVIYKVNLGN